MHKPRFATITMGLLIASTIFCSATYAGQSGALVEAARKDELIQVSEVPEKNARAKLQERSTPFCPAAAQPVKISNWPESLAQDPEILCEAANEGNVDVVRWLLEKGANPNVKDSSGLTPLMRASSAGYIHIARLLLDRGAKVNAKNRCLETVDNSGGEPNDEDRYNGVTALMRAADGGHLDLVKLLLTKGANVNEQAEFCSDKKGKKRAGWTVLMHAVGNGHFSVARLLIKKGADVKAKTTLGRTALMQASAQGDSAMVRLLVEHGSDVRAKDRDGETALMGASHKGHTEIVELLKAHGAKE